VVSQACQVPAAADHRWPAADPSSAGPRNAVTNATAVGKVVMPSHAPSGRASWAYWPSQRGGGANTGWPGSDRCAHSARMAAISSPP